MRYCLYWLQSCGLLDASNRPFVDEPIIDRKGVDMPRYYVDKAECDAYANEVRTGERVVRGVIGGATLAERLALFSTGSSTCGARCWRWCRLGRCPGKKAP